MARRASVLGEAHEVVEKLVVGSGDGRGGCVFERLLVESLMLLRGVALRPIRFGLHLAASLKELSGGVQTHIITNF